MESDTTPIESAGNRWRDRSDQEWTPVGTRYQGRSYTTLDQCEGQELLDNMNAAYRQARISQLATGSRASTTIYAGIGADEISDIIPRASSEEEPRTEQPADELMRKMYANLGIDPDTKDLTDAAKAGVDEEAQQNFSERPAELMPPELIESFLQTGSYQGAEASPVVNEMIEESRDSDDSVRTCDGLEDDHSGDILSSRVRGPILTSEPKDTGKIITEDYEVGTETIYRTDTLDPYRQILDQEIKHLENSGANPKRLARAKKEKEKFEVIKNARKSIGQQNKWVKSQDYRDLIKKTDYQSAADGFCRGCPVNMRTQEVKDSEARRIRGRLGRLGAITDVTNGWISIEELEELKNDSSKREAKMKEIEKAIHDPKPASFLARVKKLFGIKPKLNPDQIDSAFRAYNTVSLLGRKNLAEEMISDRKEQLERQMLQYLMEQIKSNPTSVRERRFCLIQLSLLNLHKKSLDSSGWMHNEATSFRDFRYIMKEFNDKKIAFRDGEGPYVDGDTIVLPQNLIQKPPSDPIDLKTYIFNLSVQGNIENDGLQKENNQEELDRLIRDYTADMNREDYKNLEHSLRDGSRSNYRLAEEFGLVLHHVAFSNGAFGINCQSGKDRTGYIASRIMIRKLKSMGLQVPREDRILNKNSAATKAARDNIPKVKVLKIDPRNALKEGLPGISRVKFALKVLPEMILSASPV